MDIVIVSQYLRNIEEIDSNNSRFIYLANLLAENKNNSVEIITSDFNHLTKKHFSNIGKLPGIKLSVFHESGYKKNISLKRFASHKELSKNISKYLNKRNKPDIVYCAIPSLDVAEAVSKYCKKNNVRFIIDIQDLWPEAFSMVFNIHILSDLFFSPLRRKANRVYGIADNIVAVSNTYAERAMSVNKKCKAPTVVYLGTEREKFDAYAQYSVNKTDGFTIGYVGSMSASYDLFSIIDSISQVNADTQIKLCAMGDGPLKESFIEYAHKKGIDAEFTGMLPYPEMVKRLLSCNIAVNPICKGSAGSIINKVGDYAMAGLPVVNTQECQEYRDLLDNYNAGINCECENVTEVTCAIELLIKDVKLRKQMALNSKNMGEIEFDRANSYERIINKIRGIK